MRILDQPTHLLLLVLVVVLLFGAKRLPDASRSLARSMRIFKSEVREMKDEDRVGRTASPGTPSRPLEGRVLAEPRAASETRVAADPRIAGETRTADDLAAEHQRRSA